MEIISKTPIFHTYTIGRMSDGSDRQIIEATTYEVIVRENFRRMRLLFDHDPTELEIAAEVAAGNYEDITTNQDLVDRIQYLEGITADLASIVLGV